MSEGPRGGWSLGCVSVPSCRHVSRSPWLPSGSRARRAVLVGSRPGSGLSYLWWTSAPGPSGPELRRETQGAWPGSAPSAGQGATTWDLIGCGPRQRLMCEGFLCVCSQRRKTVATRGSRSPASSPAPTPSSGHRHWPLPGVLHLAQLWVSVTREALPKAAVPLVPYCPHLLSAPKTDLNCFPSRRWALKRKQPNH